ncbi:MAG: 6-phosphofructokinase [Omnitrophica bacterium RIFCSPLOWO2_12_FULL_44_17]|uniref:ATP-dependent 6-phosphofructokinase n=1 Tax=Candidatus Danuiimicrobium aquiferis TaxID=1801832 RepID=A0A1G1KQZ0_9BACT|nr:MAG: 6-phosphofructokinase [Omnitrophica bacterium RIFCSPHIGHO2_02_FULL_45_28]OGW88621.1 MAG: 6-phosphofructokinase [Omnitrophica bacterium RIFCSPHIGHO2_12_FULL_44_12]OGW95278.1 MAG: 6-phosphofructokinase [Omnitrophica bacterium RIFCSPLOWO2_12_FULL_44_17]
MIKKIGVLTGGGDCPGLNAVIRAVAKTAFGRGIEVVGIKDGYDGLVLGQYEMLTESDASNILTRGGTILGTSNKADPFRYAFIKSDGTLGIEDRSQDALKNIREIGLDALIIIGGDGTLSIAQKLLEIGVPVVGVPKTIDNDLEATDLTFGFDSALSVATEAVDRLHSTAESHHRVMVLEVMGRYAGWIALRSGIAGGGDVILIPEIPYDIGKVCAAIKKRIDKGKKFSIIVVAEGAKPAGGDMVVQQTIAGSPDPIRLGGIAQVITRQIEMCSGIESRATVLGHLQRGGIPTAFDRWLATRFGFGAIELLTEGKIGRMVCLRGQNIESVEIKKAVTQLRRVDPHGTEVKAARSVGTNFGDV